MIHLSSKILSPLGPPRGTIRRLLAGCTLFTLVATLAAAPAFAQGGKPRPKAKAAADAQQAEILRDVGRKLLAYDTAAARRELEPLGGNESAGVLMAEGRVLAQEKKFGPAAAKLRAACEAGPADPAPWNFLGVAYRYQKRGKEASGAFQEAVRRAQARLAKNPRAVHAHYHLGVAQIYRENWGAALRSLGKARELDPDNPLPVYQIGHAYHEQDKHREAVETLSASIEMDSGIAYAYFYRGLSASKIGRKDLLVADLNRFLKLAPEAPEAPLAARIVASTRR